MKLDPDLDLTLGRVIRAPRDAVWRAWTRASSLEQWWLPAPARCRVDRLELVPGGAFVTRMSQDGVAFAPHLDACFLAVDELERIAFTTALDSRWRPAGPDGIVMTAEITLAEHPEGTDYRVIVRHRDPAARTHHDELGFYDGWGTVTDQLAARVEAGGHP
jgi:uncharacterized protein YndB with AHSA1/START domain